MKAWMSSNFGQIPTPTPELSALACLKNCCIMLCLVDTLAPSFFYWIFFILAGIEDMHESLDEFEFRQICNRVTALD